MALNFPIPTSVGQVYQDPTSGNTYVCTSLGPPAQWVGSGSSTSLDGTYLRKDASNDPVTGNLLLNPTTNVSPLTLQQPVGNTTPVLKIENSGSGNSIEADGGFALSNTGVLTLGTALAIASGGTGSNSAPSARQALEVVGTSELVGQVAFFAMSSPPPGWLKANGALLSRTTYANLFAAIGTTFGAGDGSTTFALPDLRGEFLRGWDDGRGIDAGRVVGTSQQGMSQINPGVLVHAATFGYADGRYDHSGISNSVLANDFDVAPFFNTTGFYPETRPRNIALLACIRF